MPAPSLLRRQCPSGSSAQPVAGRDLLEVALVEELDAHPGVELAQLPQLAVLAGYERLLHHGHFEIEILLREVEVGGERLAPLSLLPAFDRERQSLAQP